MAKVMNISEIRPLVTDEFQVGPFVPRTESMQHAWDWGKKVHAGQTRLSGEPYFETHCAWVGAFVDKLVHNETWTIAALLHDTVEDQGETLEEIRKQFPGELGIEVAHIIDGLTKISNPRDGSSREMETLRKIARFRDPAVFVIKLADKSHNLMTLQYQPPAKRWAKATEAIRAYGKLAGILNCYRWRRWIEDMAFPYAEPNSFPIVKAKIDADPRLNINFIRYYLNELGSVMDAEGIDGSIMFTVNGYWQSWDKLQRMARSHRTSLEDFSAVNDIVSFRMLVNGNNEIDCYRLLARVNKYFQKYLDQDRFDDYIASPQNGYQALQATAWLPGTGAIEVAIATEEMEGENTWGIIHALNHQKDTSSYQPVQIFTSYGGTRFLKEGSTVLDGVAAIKDFYLDKITKVLVNGEEKHIYDNLNPGDVVEVVSTGPHKIPEPDWLNHCNASTARRLRNVLTRVKLKLAGEEGRRRIHPILAKEGILDLNDVLSLEPNRLESMLGLLACANLEALYEAIGGGSIFLDEVESAMDATHLTASQLKWTSFQIRGNNNSNQPGGLAYFASLVTEAGGNILRTVNTTSKTGDFDVRMVLNGLSEEQKSHLQYLFNQSRFPLTDIEIA